MITAKDSIVVNLNYFRILLVQCHTFSSAKSAIFVHQLGYLDLIEYLVHL